VIRWRVDVSMRAEGEGEGGRRGRKAEGGTTAG